MTDHRVLAVESKDYRDLDSTAVWSLVADPGRLADWFPLVPLKPVSTVDPGPGTETRVSWRRGTSPATAWRAVVVEWDAGTAYRCRIDRIPGLGEAELTVSVDTRPAGDGTRVTLRFVATADSRLRGLLAGFEARRRLLRSLDRIGRAARP